MDSESRTAMPHMHAMVLERARAPLVMRERAVPAPGPGEVLVEIAACGVRRTTVHVVDGELPDPALPLVPGHEIVGRVAALGPRSEEHTSELQSRFGISYAVFCLK